MRSISASSGSSAAHTAAHSSAPWMSPDGERTPTSASSSRTARLPISAAAACTQGSIGVTVLSPRARCARRVTIACARVRGGAGRRRLPCGLGRDALRVGRRAVDLAQPGLVPVPGRGRGAGGGVVGSTPGAAGRAGAVAGRRGDWAPLWCSPSYALTAVVDGEPATVSVVLCGALAVAIWSWWDPSLGCVRGRAVGGGARARSPRSCWWSWGRPAMPTTRCSGWRRGCRACTSGRARSPRVCGRRQRRGELRLGREVAGRPRAGHLTRWRRHRDMHVPSRGDQRVHAAISRQVQEPPRGRPRRSPPSRS